MDRRAVFRYMSIWGAAVALSEPDLLLAAAAPTQGNAAFNQSGYAPHSEKIVSLPGEDAADRSFQIYSEQTGRSVFQGQLTASSIDSASGDRVALADFSPLTVPGIYRLVVQGVRSQPFLVRKDAYLKPLALSVRAFYGQRCGCEVDLGGGYRHAKCHASGAYH